MKLADLIPEPLDHTGIATSGYNLAVENMTRLVTFAEAAGYRLVLAMPQHIEPADDALPWDGEEE